MAEEPAPASADTIQPSLFADNDVTRVRQPVVSLIEFAAPTGDTSLSACALPYQAYLQRTDRKSNTISCFLSDLRMLTDYLGDATATRDVTREHLTTWLEDLRLGRATRSARGERPAPKSISRRISFVKNFFGWLHESGALAHNPAEQIPPARPLPPLPELLYDDEVERLLAAAKAEGVRCHTLVLLLLATGLKKEEVMGLTPGRVDLSIPEHPAIEVRFPREAKRRRERRMELPAEWAELYVRYRDAYNPREFVFECTDRNLNYVLAGAVKRAGLEKRVTLQLLRDIYAVRQLRNGVPLDTLRERLGLSEEAWYETADKYRKLAFPA